MKLPPITKAQFVRRLALLLAMALYHQWAATHTVTGKPQIVVVTEVKEVK